MPTPFTHLVAAERLLADAALPSDARALLRAHEAAYLLGSVAADAHFLAGRKREDTHFYSYNAPITQPPWRLMLTEYPQLVGVQEPAQRAFLAGYVAHLAMDEVWTRDMLFVHFGERDWAPRPRRFLLLNVMLITMDERDYDLITPRAPGQLCAALPCSWLPFLGDETLCQWRDLIHRQIVPGGISETYTIIAPRVSLTADDLRALVHSPQRLETELWAHVPHDLLLNIEAQMYTHARSQLSLYLRDC